MLTVLPSIAIIGAGRVGSALARGLKRAGYVIVGIASHNQAYAQHLASSVESSALPISDLLASADLIFATVPDDALTDLACDLAQFRPTKSQQAIVHCSGALSSEVLQPLADVGWITGSCHPLQAFASVNVEVQHGITWGIEAEQALRPTLHRLVKHLDGRPLDLEPSQKVLYHTAAVLSCNFAITLAARAVDLLALCGIEREQGLQALLPLLQGNLSNLANVGLPNALTGPLARGDWGTIERHLNALDQQAPDVAALYRCCIEATVPLVRDRVSGVGSKY